MVSIDSQNIRLLKKISKIKKYIIYLHFNKIILLFQ